MKKYYVSRPKGKKSRINCKDEFELCYIRHKYLRKIKFNPTEKQMKPFMKIAAKFANKTFFRHTDLFNTVGLGLEDIVNIANIHIVNFLGLFSLQKLPDKYKEFSKIFSRIQDRKPNTRDVLDKNQANFTLFIKQRMEDMVRICKQKVRNICGTQYNRFCYYYGTEVPPNNLRLLLEDHEKFGYKKLDINVFKCIKKKAGLVESTIFKYNDSYYVAIPIEIKKLGIEDFSGANIDPYDNMHNKTPEDIYFDLENTDIWNQRQEDFDNKSIENKIQTIKNFIKNNKNNRQFKEEIDTAKKLLEKLKECHD